MVGLPHAPRNCLPDSEAVNGDELGNFYRPVTRLRPAAARLVGFDSATGISSISLLRSPSSSLAPLPSKLVSLRRLSCRLLDDDPASPLIRRPPCLRLCDLLRTKLSSATSAASALNREIAPTSPIARKVAQVALFSTPTFPYQLPHFPRRPCCLSTLHLPTWLPSIPRLLA